MVIVDRELLGKESEKEFEYSKVPLGIFLENEFQKNISEYGDANWLTDASTAKTMTYGQMLNAVRSVASALRKRGLRTGDNVAIVGSNHMEIPLMFMGAWRAGGSQMCIEVNLPTDVIESKMKEVGSKFVLTDKTRADRILNITSRLDSVREVFVMDGAVGSGCTPFEELLQDSGEECPKNLDDVDLNSMAWLSFTSGTTGTPKGVILTHRTLVGSFSQLRNRQEGVIGKRLKYFFVNGMTLPSGVFGTMKLSLLHMDGYMLSEFSEENLLICIDRYKPTDVSLLPHYISWLCQCDHLSKYDLSSVTTIYTVGSVLNSVKEREIFNKLPNLLFITNNYAMTETGVICVTPQIPPSERLKLTKEKAIFGRVFGSVGRVVPYCKIKVVDPLTGEKLGPNQIGEICVHSPFMLKEYLNQPKETAEFLRDGWAHTGDRGYYDENENLFIDGRYRELIKYRNIHVVPTDVEKLIMTHPAVKDAAVVGQPCDADGERPLAFVVLSPDSGHITTDELISFTNERARMDEEKLRGGIRFIEEVPRNSSGKIVRSTLVKLLSES